MLGLVSTKIAAGSGMTDRAPSLNVLALNRGSSSLIFEFYSVGSSQADAVISIPLVQKNPSGQSCETSSRAWEHTDYKTSLIILFLQYCSDTADFQSRSANASQLRRRGHYGACRVVT